MSRVTMLGLAVWLTACHGSSDVKRVGRHRPNVCVTEEARAVTEQPEFEAQYEYCTTGNRAIGARAVAVCMQKQSGLSEECASCYSWYKACVLRSCFSACQTPRPEVYCSICRRTSCQGQFLQCSGTTQVFPASKD
jgi:hypothetical protein